MKKLIVLLLALVCALSLVACDKGEKDVEEFMNEYFELSSEEFDDYEDLCDELKEFCDPDGKQIKEIDESLEEYEESIEEGAVEMGSEEMAIRIKNHLYNARMTTSSFEIVEITVDGDEATVEYEKTALDQELSEDAFLEGITEIFSNYVGPKYNMSIQDLNTVISQSDQQQRQAIYKELYENCEDEIFDLITEISENEDYHETVDRTATLKKVDGKWLIHKIK